MVSRDDMMAKRDEMLARRDELMERAQELGERFQGAVDEDLATTAMGWTLVSGGVAFGVTQLVRGHRRWFALALPLLLVVAGAGLLGRGFMQRRTTKIGEAEAHVREQLASLDPVARFQVVRDMGRETLPFVRHSHN